MAFALDDLDLALDHDAFVGRVEEVRVLDDGAVLELDLRLDLSWTEGSKAGDLAGRVGLRFRGVRFWSLGSEAITSMSVVANHPALVAFEGSISRLSYRGEPTDAEGALAALHLAHARAVGDVVPIKLQPGSAFPAGWSTGTVAVGSTSLMQVYAEALRGYGVKPILTETHSPPLESRAAGLSVFTIGRGYVIAAQLETHGEIPPNDFT